MDYLEIEKRFSDSISVRCYNEFIAGNQLKFERMIRILKWRVRIWQKANLFLFVMCADMKRLDGWESVPPARHGIQ